MDDDLAATAPARNGTNENGLGRYYDDTNAPMDSAGPTIEEVGQSDNAHDVEADVKQTAWTERIKQFAQRKPVLTAVFSTTFFGLLLLIPTAVHLHRQLEKAQAESVALKQDLKLTQQLQQKLQQAVKDQEQQLGDTEQELRKHRQSTHDALNRLTTKTASDISQLAEGVQEADAKTSNATNDLHALRQTVDDVQGHAQGLSGSLEALRQGANQAVDRQGLLIDQLQSTTNNHEERISTLEGRADDDRLRVVALEAETTQRLDAQAQACRQSAEQLTAQVRNLQEELEEVEGDVNASLTTHGQRISVLQRDQLEIAREVDAQAQTTGSISAAVQRTQQAAQGQATRLQSLQVDLENAHDRFGALEANIETLGADIEDVGQGTRQLADAVVSPILHLRSALNSTQTAVNVQDRQITTLSSSMTETLQDITQRLSEQATGAQRRRQALQTAARLRVPINDATSSPDASLSTTTYTRSQKPSNPR